ncbi:MAG: hypothetical protein AM324_005395 [Candidatus Thorarchaeota archaeon SMTZ1-83]|nr:MAG: hypothetical protein AM324_06635 [Candidatus Thorarchaeota archaeon SMTZ1-83]
MGLADSIRNYFDSHPRAKKALGVASAIAANFAMLGSGSAVLAVAAGTIVKHQEEKSKVKSDELMDFFKDAIQDPAVRESIKDAVREGGVNVASNVNTSMNQLSAVRPDAGQYVDTMKSEISVIAQQMGIIRDLVSYYEIPDSLDRVKNVWRLPSYIDSVIVIDSSLRSVLDTAIGHIEDGKNVVILGAPGSGKTTALYAIWKELDEESNAAIVWDTKDVGRVHEKDGVILFNDDIPETRKLVKAVIERDVRGLVTTAREQDWARLPIELRVKFTSVSLPMVQDEVMRKIAVKHLESQNVKYSEQAVAKLAEKAQGSPIYVRYMIEEIAADVKAGGSKKLTETRVREAPKGMTDYVAGILTRILFSLDGTIYTPREGALPVIKTLLCLADMPNYETHEAHLNQMFFKLKSPTDSPGPFNAIKQYLSRDPSFFSLKFMHDTLADVLRGRVDHPIVGDIRMLAQEMGASGRRIVETEALVDGWQHVKAEYEMDHAGGLEPLLAYGYFATKNFGIDHLDKLAIDLANRHIENPLSQGLLAMTGPVTEADSMRAIEPAEPKVKSPGMPAAPSGDQFIPDDVRVMLEQDGIELTESVMNEVRRGLAELEQLQDMGDFGTKIYDLVQSNLAKAGLAEAGVVRKSRYDELRELLKQDSVSPSRLQRALERASERAYDLREDGKLTDAAQKGELLVEASSRLVLLDSALYLEILEEISSGLSATLGESRTAETLAKLTDNIAVSMLDEKSRKQIIKVFDGGIRRSQKSGDYDGMQAHLVGKWSLFGIDPKDLDFAARSVNRLMKLGRTVFALENLIKLNSSFDETQIEHRLGMTQQAFRGLSKATVTERGDFNRAVGICHQELLDIIKVLEGGGLLPRNDTAAGLCNVLLASTVPFMDGFVKRSGKSIAAEAVYPLLHESIKPLVLSVVDTLRKIGIEKSWKTAAGTVQKLNGESIHKEEMLSAIQSLK